MKPTSKSLMRREERFFEERRRQAISRQAAAKPFHPYSKKRGHVTAGFTWQALNALAHFFKYVLGGEEVLSAE